jgi:hypothetical protein
MDVSDKLQGSTNLYPKKEPLVPITYGTGSERFLKKISCPFRETNNSS